MRELASLPVEIGAVLAGRYRIDAVLGAGGMGIVFRAHHLELRQDVAVKMPYRERAFDPQTVERLLREARAAVRLKSEHVCRVIDVGRSEEGLAFVVMEYLEGTLLSDRLRRKRVLPFDEISRLLLQSCEALGEAHELGIVHRDLKPANLFLVTGLDRRRRVKVLDFGISKIENYEISDHRLTESAVLLGSPSYIAPEQMSDTRSVDARADIWGLGICAYELLTGHVPFKGSSVMDLAVRIAGDVAVPPSVLRPDVPPALEAIVLRCLAKNRDERFASMAELSSALLAAASPEVALEYGAMRGFASSTAMQIVPAIDAADSTPVANERTETSDGLHEREERLATPMVAQRTVPDPTPAPCTTRYPAPAPRTRGAKYMRVVPALALLAVLVLGAAGYAASSRRAGTTAAAPPGQSAPMATAGPASVASASEAPGAGVDHPSANPSASPAGPVATGRSTPPVRAVRAPRIAPSASTSTSPAPDSDAIPRTR